MQGSHSFDPHAETVISLDSFVPKDHFLRKVDRALDLSFVRELTAPCYADRLGRPSIDPEIYFRMQLVAYLYGIRSERRLCEDIHCDLAYRWFCHLPLSEEVPDHSSLTTIRDRFGEEIFEKVFCQIVELCRKKGLVHEECQVMTDATLIAADASTQSMVPNDPEPTPQGTESPPHGSSPATTPTKQKVSNHTHHSRTDPDATLARKNRTPLQLKYKVHQTIDAESRVILDTHVTTGAVHDSQPYLEQLGRVRDRYKIQICEATADRGYGSAEIIKALKEKAIKSYIPLWNRRCGKNSGAAVGLVYEREHDRIRCPAGKYLRPTPGDYWNRKRYSLSGECANCPLASTCPAKTRPKAPHTRFVLRPNDQDVFDEVQAQMTEPEFGEKLSERMWKCEGLFAEAKQYHGLSRAKYRGRSKVQIQAYFIAIVQNLKRLLFPLYCWLVACRERRTRDAQHA